MDKRSKTEAKPILQKQKTRQTYHKRQVVDIMKFVPLGEIQVIAFLPRSEMKFVPFGSIYVTNNV